MGQLFNSYADNAGYNDLCLLIYHAADYRNPRVVSDTWKQLIYTTHGQIEERRTAYEAHQQGRAIPEGAEDPTSAPPQPYEAISVQIETIAHRTSLDSLVFPVDTLLAALCEYAITKQQDASIGADPAWPVLLFLQLGISHAMIVRVLERILDAQEAPFTRGRRKVVVEWINTAVGAWLREVERRGLNSGKGGGDSLLAPWVLELMERADQAIGEIRTSSRDAQLRAEAEDIHRKTRSLKTMVANAVRPSTQPGFRYR